MPSRGVNVIITQRPLAPLFVLVRPSEYISYSGSSTTVKDAHGSGSFRDNSNAVFNFVATKTDLFQLASGAFTSRKGSLTGDDAGNPKFSVVKFLAATHHHATGIYLTGSNRPCENL